MVQKHGKSGLNNGASMKFGETNCLMKQKGYKTGSFIRKLFIAGEEGAPVPSGDLLKTAGSSRVRRDSDRGFEGELDSLRELEDNGSTELPMYNAKDRNPVYLSLNKHSRWDLLEKLKDHVQFQRVFEEKVESINSPVLGITLVEKYGDYLHGHLSTKDTCSYISYESNMAAKETPVSAKGNTAFLWDLRNKSNKLDTTADNYPKAKRSAQHNQHFRGVQRRKSTDRKSFSIDLEDKKSARFSQSLQSDCPEVFYEVTYPRPLDASSGSQDLKVRRWNWCFRDRKSLSKCKGQKISRRADYYCLSQKDLKNWKLYGDIDNEAKLFSNLNNEPKLNFTPNLSYKLETEDPQQRFDFLDFETNPYEDVDPRLYLSLLLPDGCDDFDKIMLSDHLNEEKLAQLEQTSHFVTEATHNDTEYPEGYDFKTRDPTFPWGTPFELSMIKVDEDTLLDDEFEFVESPEAAGDEFEVVENAGKVPNAVDGVLLLEKEDSGFIHVDSKNIISPPRQSLTLGDFMKHKNKKNRAKGLKSKQNLKKSS